MTAPFKTWTVLPHGKLVAVTPDILTVVGDIRMPIGDFPRRMTVVRVNSGDLVIFSAVSLDEPQMSELEAFGRPAWLIVPSDRHRLDVRPWKDRYPKIAVIAPSGARAKVGEVVAVDATRADFGDAGVRLLEVPGTHGHDAALEVWGDDGLTLILNEVIAAMHGAGGLKGWLLRMMGFAGDEPHVPAPVKMGLADGKAALADQFLHWAMEPDLKRIIVSHGDIIEDDPKGVLSRLAESLA